jgi:hypothetical protein
LGMAVADHINARGVRSEGAAAGGSVAANHDHRRSLLSLIVLIEPISTLEGIYHDQRPRR